MALGSGFMIKLRPWTFGSHGFGSSDPEASGSGPSDQRHCAASSPIALCAYLSVSLFFWSLFCFLLSEDDSSSEISLRRCVAFGFDYVAGFCLGLLFSFGSLAGKNV